MKDDKCGRSLKIMSRFLKPNGSVNYIITTIHLRSENNCMTFDFIAIAYT